MLAVPIAFAQSDLVDSYPLNDRPVDIALSFDDKFLYVNTAGEQVLKIDTASTAVVSTTFNQRSLPLELSQDTTYLGYEFEINPLDNSATITCSRTGESEKKLAVGNAPVAFVISKDGIMYVANSGDNTISVLNLKDILKTVPPCRRSYFLLFVISLTSLIVFFIVALILGFYHISLLKEEKKLAKFILDHLEKGHHLEDIHTHLRKYTDINKVHKATKRAYAHMERLKSGKPSKLV